MGSKRGGTNQQFAHWFALSGFNRTELARQVVEEATQRGHRGIASDESRVRRWLNGEQPRDPVPQLLADILSARLATPLTPADLGMPGPVRSRRFAEMPWHAASVIAEIAQMTRSDMMLAHSRDSAEAQAVYTGGDLIPPLQRWAYTAPTPLDTHDGRRRRIGAGEVEQIRTVIAMFRDADNRLGGALSRKAVIAQLHDVNGLLTSTTYTEATGRDLFAAVADLGSVAGWMTFDAGLHQKAQHLFITALRAATEADDRGLGAHILQCMARQMSHLNHVEDALELVALARYGARRHTTPGMRAVLASLDARFHAILGMSDDSQRAADDAQEAFERIEPDNEPAWTAFFDAAELHATLGIAHQIAARTTEDTRLRARHAEQSAAMLRQAVAARPDERVRSTAFDHVGLARTHLVVGEVDGALEAANTAVSLFGTVASTRVADRLVELHAETERYAHMPAVQELRERLERLSSEA